MQDVKRTIQDRLRSGCTRHLRRRQRNGKETKTIIRIALTTNQSLSVMGSDGTG